MKRLKCYSNPTCANDRLLSIIRFVSQFPDGFYNLFFISIQKPLPTSFRHIRRDTKKFSSPQLNTPLLRRNRRQWIGLMLSQDKRYGQLYVPGLLLNKSTKYQDNPMKHKMHQLFVAHAASEARVRYWFLQVTPGSAAIRRGRDCQLPSSPAHLMEKRSLLHQFLKVRS